MSETRSEYGVLCRDYNGAEWVEDGNDEGQVWSRERAEQEIEFLRGSTTINTTLVRREVQLGEWGRADV
jgi:hypothetical protein